ncbi:acyltransferase [Clostridium butyricum]|uniref:acyltransferase n=1 Tax=Clostridium butyricum TaxID=1492 RepID=UPI0005C23845|nr:acyltransferase [Clostridium butyricum]KIU07588.1 membrane protein [Clostridium butyricum]MBA8967421.1 surface polysaccharide O-acyltransferase-like enzyme [Clostridium butyricum]MBA8971513.1 surface polysaccharide O-acyltransferase-like enzyme [Clostridium butyricum]MBC2427953.1 acyltransferase [Clostridium butyricum]NOW36622.1 surface polysaccharide O-acyltransferase-like enzyme [Clostridium butyricum]
MKKERLLELDVMRGIAFLFIVLQHTIGGFSYRDDISFNNFIVSKFIYIGAETGVELFIFLTAASLIYTYINKFDIKDFYIKKLKFLVLPFVIWSIIIMINNGQTLNVQSILVIFTGDAQYHLWYMGMILRIYLYFPIILWITKKVLKQNIYIKSGVFILLAYLYSYVLNHYGIAGFVIEHLFKNPSDLEKKLVNISPIFYYFYFVIGVYAICNYKKFKEKVLKFKYLISAVYIITFGFYFYIAVTERYSLGLPVLKSSIEMSILYRTMSILFFYLVSCIIAEKFSIMLNILTVISRYSFPAYLIHVMILNRLTLYVATGPQIIYYLRYFFMVSSISIAISWLINYIPYSEYIIGVRSKFKFNTGYRPIHFKQIGQ